MAKVWKTDGKKMRKKMGKYDKKRRKRIIKENTMMGKIKRWEKDGKMEMVRRRETDIKI